MIIEVAKLTPDHEQDITVTCTDGSKIELTIGFDLITKGQCIRVVTRGEYLAWNEFEVVRTVCMDEPLVVVRSIAGCNLTNEELQTKTHDIRVGYLADLVATELSTKHLDCEAYFDYTNEMERACI